MFWPGPKRSSDSPLLSSPSLGRRGILPQVRKVELGESRLRANRRVLRLRRGIARRADQNSGADVGQERRGVNGTSCRRGKRHRASAHKRVGHGVAVCSGFDNLPLTRRKLLFPPPYLLLILLLLPILLLLLQPSSWNRRSRNKPRAVSRVRSLDRRESINLYRGGTFSRELPVLLWSVYF